jgi:hypothetical protein
MCFLVKWTFINLCGDLDLDAPSRGLDAPDVGEDDVRSTSRDVKHRECKRTNLFSV